LICDAPTEMPIQPHDSRDQTGVQKLLTGKFALVDNPIYEYVYMCISVKVCDNSELGDVVEKSEHLCPCRY